jgi:hypothetical protein
VVAPRSLQDPVLHEEGGSQYVLVPKQVKEKQYDADGKTVASSRAGDRPAGPSRFDEVDEWVRGSWLCRCPLAVRRCAP